MALTKDNRKEQTLVCLFFRCRADWQHLLVRADRHLAGHLAHRFRAGLLRDHYRYPVRYLTPQAGPHRPDDCDQPRGGIGSLYPLTAGNAQGRRSPRVPVPISLWPVMVLRLTACLPNGKKVKVPITKQARPQGMPTSEIKQIRPASHQDRPIKTPPSTNQSRLNKKREKAM